MQSNVLLEEDEDDAQIEPFEDAVELHSPRVLEKFSKTIGLLPHGRRR